MNTQQTHRTQTTQGPQASAQADTRQARRLLGMGLLLFGLTAVVTVFFSIFAALTWAVPVLSAAMALGCWLVVMAINGEARDAAHFRREAQKAAQAAGDARRPREAQPGAERTAAVKAPKQTVTVKAPKQGAEPAAEQQKTAAAKQTAAKQAAARPAASASQAGRAQAAAPAARETRSQRVRRLAASSLKRNDFRAREVLDLATDELPVVTAPAEKRRPAGAAGREFSPKHIPVPTYVAASKAAAREEASLAAAERETAAAAFAEAAGATPELLDAAADGTAALKHGRKAIRADRYVARRGASKRAAGASAVGAGGTAAFGSAGTAAEAAAFEKVNDLLARRRA